MESGPTPSAPVKTETRSSYFHQSFTAPVVEFGTAIVGLVNRALDAVPTRASTKEAVVSEAAGSTVDVDCAHQAFDDCLNRSEFDDMGKCHYYMDMMAYCCRNSSS